MELLTEIKFSHNRNKRTAALLIHFYEITYLALLLTPFFPQFYLSTFGLLLGTSHSSLVALITIFILFTLILFCIFLVLVLHRGSFLLPFLSNFLKCFLYFLTIPLLCFNLEVLIEGETLMSLIFSGFNVLMTICLSLAHEALNWSCRFKQVDYCNRHNNSLLSVTLVIASVFLMKFTGSPYTGLIYFVRAILCLSTLTVNFEYSTIQSLQLFYSLLSVYFPMIVLMDDYGLFPRQIGLIQISILIAIGALIAHNLTRTLVIYINDKIGNKNGEGKGDIETQSEKNSKESVNVLQYQVQALLQHERRKKGKDNSYEHYWRIYDHKIFIHKLKCLEVDCECKQTIEDSEIYLSMLSKELKQMSLAHSKENLLKILNIYLFIEIAKKPLKGYYELMLLKRQSNRISTQMEIRDLTNNSRQCFDRIFEKEKVQNQKLELMQAIEQEKALQVLQSQLQMTIQNTISFKELFICSTVEIEQIKQESNKLFAIKQEIEETLQKIVNDSADTNNFKLVIFIFYRYLEVYRSKENYFKKIANQQLMKRRIYQKADSNIFDSKNGIIYIDLIEERGKILKITKSISNFFGYPPEDLLSFNINLFMPRLFGKHHARFLSNFVEKGKIKLLKEKSRIVFGKNKFKFIFPINIRLKTEHLEENQFGATALITQIQTNSLFVIAGSAGRIEEISEELYKRLFGHAFKEEIAKVNKLCLYKMILSLNQLIGVYDPKDANKIYQGLLVYSERDDYLLEKFRLNKENSRKLINSKSLSNTIQNSDGFMGKMSDKISNLTEIFRLFLAEVNPLYLKGLKISYKYTRAFTNEFQVDLIEILNIREEVTGKNFLQQLHSELTNVVEVYELNEEHSPIAKNLKSLADKVNQLHEIELEMPSIQIKKIDQPRQMSEKTLKNNFSDCSFLQDDDRFNDKQNNVPMVQASEASSVMTGSEPESKKQILINAFNAQSNVVSMNGFIVFNSVIFLLLLILSLSIYFSFTYLEQTTLLWHDNTFILRFKHYMQYEIALSQLDLFQNNTGISLPFIAQLRSELNAKMAALLQSINSQTYQSTLYDSPILLTSSFHNLTSSQPVSQLLNTLLYLYTVHTPETISYLRENYETLHSSFASFSTAQQAFMDIQNTKHLTQLYTLLGAYEFILFLIGVSLIPIYIYYKQKEHSVRKLLSYLNVKEIKKSIIRLRIINDILKEREKNQKSNSNKINQIQTELIENKKFEREEEGENTVGNKFIKIMPETQEQKIFWNPNLYLLLLGFLLFFSNASIAQFAIASTTNDYFEKTLEVNTLSSRLQDKSPLLINVYLSNINRFYGSLPLKQFSSGTYAETTDGYFDLLNRISTPSLSAHVIAEMISAESTSPLCSSIPCSHPSTSFSYLSLKLKQIMTYWSPSLPYTHALIEQWAADNNLEQLLLTVPDIFAFSEQLNGEIDRKYVEYTGSKWRMLLIISLLVIPVNIVAAVLLEIKLVAKVNSIIKSAEHIFIHFHVSVLIENTYLTSYFNSKNKQVS